MDYPYRFTKTLSKKTKQMQTQWKPQTTYTCTQRLTETRTDTNTDTHTCKHRNIKLFKLNKISTKQIQYK